MKKIILFGVILLSLFRSYILASCDGPKEADCDWAITIKNGYFYPQDKTLRCIFDRCGSKGGYWLELAVRYNFWKGLNVEASGSYFKRKGRALYSSECTEVKIPTVGLGLKYFFTPIDFCDDCDCCDNCNNWWSFFLGGGLRVFFYHEKNNYPYVLSCREKTTAGGMVNAGFEFRVWKGLLINLFADYNFKKLRFCCDNTCGTSNCQSTCSNTSNNVCACPSCNFDIHLGGLVAGVGIGYAF